MRNPISSASKPLMASSTESETHYATCPEASIGNTPKANALKLCSVKRSYVSRIQQLRMETKRCKNEQAELQRHHKCLLKRLARLVKGDWKTNSTQEEIVWTYGKILDANKKANRALKDYQCEPPADLQLSPTSLTFAPPPSITFDALPLATWNKTQCQEWIFAVILEHMRSENDERPHSQQAWIMRRLARNFKGHGTLLFVMQRAEWKRLLRTCMPFFVGIERAGNWLYERLWEIRCDDERLKEAQVLQHVHRQNMRREALKEKSQEFWEQEKMWW